MTCQRHRVENPEWDAPCECECGMQISIDPANIPYLNYLIHFIQITTIITLRDLQSIKTHKNYVF